MNHALPAGEIARQLVGIPTVNPPGREAQAQAFVASVLEKAGVAVEWLEREPGRPNLLARLPGRGERPHLVLHGHVDVVGVDGQTWDHPPFEALVEDGVLHGRGALDMKSGVAMMLHAFSRAKLEGLRPAGDVLLVVVSDSETGGAAGLGYLLEEHGELFEGARYAIGEFGGFPLYAFGRKFYRIGVSQKHYAHLRIRLRGGGGHGSGLITDTVVGALGRVLATLDEIVFPHHRTPVVERIVHAIAAAVPEKAETLRGLLDPDQFEAALLDLGPEGNPLEPLFRDTANPTIVSAGAKFNVIPSEATIEIDARLLPGRDVGDLIGEIRSRITEDLILEVVAEGATGPPDFDDGLFGALASVLQDMDPAGIPIPFLFNESPDGRLFHQRGIQHFGFLPMDLPPEIDLPALIHGPKERVPLSAVDSGAEALFGLLERY